MVTIRSKNALETYGALYITIGFRVFEKPNEKFISDGQSTFIYNVKRHRKKMLSNAIYNAIKQKFPNRTITPYDIHILDYHYTYFLEDYEVINKKENDKYVLYETYTDLKTNEKKEVLHDKYTIKDKIYVFMPDYEPNII